MNGNVIAVSNAVNVDRKRKMVMMYHIALEITDVDGKKMMATTKRRSDKDWVGAVEREIADVKANRLMAETVELLWVKEWQDA
jgi:hypothetical protein|tara:strand:- start:827 stop:1075 length:249 start_codon:yes stop_codon:yes gene_type:complete